MRELADLKDGICYLKKYPESRFMHKHLDSHNKTTIQENWSKLQNDVKRYKENNFYRDDSYQLENYVVFKVVRIEVTGFLNREVVSSAEAILNHLNASKSLL